MTARDLADRTSLGLPSSDSIGRELGAPEDRVVAIHGSIARAVTEQRLFPGTRLPEDQIGGLFGSSRTLVRAALQRLAHDGLVTLTRNRGAFVASPSIQEAREVFEARRIIEGVTVVRAAASIEPHEIIALEDVLHRGRRAMDAGERGAAIRLSGEFHLGIGACGRQAVLQGFLVELVSRSSLVISLYGLGFSSACADEEHRDLLDALRERAADKALHLMLAHLHHIEADLDLGAKPQKAVSLAEALGVNDGARG